jgi:hypothetical protein
MTIIGVAINDDNGNPTGDCQAMTFDIDGEQAIEIECEVTFRHLEDKKAVRIGRKEYPIHGYHTWVGNMAWDSFLVKPEVAAQIINAIRPNAQCIAGWSALFEKYRRGEDFTAADFEVKE